MLRLIQIIHIWLFLISMNSSAMTANDDQYLSFRTIDKVILEKIIATEMPKKWDSGLRNSFHLLSWAYQGDLKPEHVDIQSEKSYIKYPPEVLVAFLNRYLPSKYKTFVSDLKDELNEQNLLDIIETNISNGLPLSAYVVRNGRLGLLTIFGISHDSTQVLVSNHRSVGNEPITMEIGNLLQAMNLSQWLERLRNAEYDLKQQQPEHELLLDADNFLNQMKIFNIVKYQIIQQPPRISAKKAQSRLQQILSYCPQLF